jgi:alpha-tubulin suppressor-like RCC1 family protein
VSCGLHHTLLLSAAGLVLSFGSNSWGQLGVGDLIPHGAPVPLHRLDEVVTKISAGAYHSVALTSSGRVYTWGNNSKGQLGRSPPPEDAKLPPVEIGMLTFILFFGIITLLYSLDNTYYFFMPVEKQRHTIVICKQTTNKINIPISL